MRVFFDANVLLDIGLARAPHDIASSEAYNLCDEPGYERWAAWHSISNISYIMRRSKGDAATRQFIRDLSDTINIAQAGSIELKQALSFALSDFEDAMQLSAAIACGADCIVTRNANDFSASPIRVMTPQEFVNQSQPTP